jgi:hypothetical protein
VHPSCTNSQDDFHFKWMLEHTITRDPHCPIPRALQPPLPLRIERYPLGVIPAIHLHGEPCL